MSFRNPCVPNFIHFIKIRHVIQPDVRAQNFCLVTARFDQKRVDLAKDLNVQNVFNGVIPFLIADGVTVVLLVTFPGVVTQLPSLS